MANLFKSYFFLPILLVINMGAGILVCYGMAVHNGHVLPPPSLPYVSDTGAYPKESCIFTLVLTWGAFMMMAVSYLYYKFINWHDPFKHKKLNLWALVISSFSAVGVTLVGSFQWNHASIPHLVGAFTAFFGTTIYSWMVVFISFRTYVVDPSHKVVFGLRIFLALVETVFLVGLILVPSQSKISMGPLNMEPHKRAFFSALAEWCLIYSSVFFMGTFAHEFREIKRVDVKLTFLLEEEEPLLEEKKKPLDTVKDERG